MLRFILLSILFTIIFRKVWSFFLYLRRVLGGDNQNEIRRTDYDVRRKPQSQKRKKIFKENDGEYVEYEEVN